ncbi:hypothetical protein Clacol_004531 [Clathrus columnatus]|uniref:Uncharacterized protein n=1 Tax=Clathrus columnatus TaxID=1419009 RepID=A0AAV5A7R5_9AGAM|nr:hypothetical protein Clacol_004531 [Clathrus columnatus]
MNTSIQMTSDELAQSASEATIQMETYMAASGNLPGIFVSPTPNPKEIMMPQTSLCNGLQFFSDAIETLPFIGVQGLISIRTLALCQGYWPMAVALSTTFLAALILDIYVVIIDRCDSQPFVLIVTVTQLVVDYNSPIAGSDVAAFQNALLPLRLSVILICEFTLDLRRRNTTTGSLPNPSALELPDLNLSSQGNPGRSIKSVLGRLQEMIIADMEESDTVDIDVPVQGDSSDPETA